MTDQQRLLETGAAVLVFMAVFVFGGRMYPLRAILRNEKSFVSFSAGIALAYVFVHVMPEMSGARETFVKYTTLPKIFEGMVVYLFAMLGFLFFYALDQLAKRERPVVEEGQAGPHFDLKVIGFAGYVCLISYLLVDNLDNSPLSSATYAFAMAVHFLTFDHGFRKRSGGEVYKRHGHLLLAAAAPVGWLIGLAFVLPKDILALMLGFLSGGIIVNTSIDELPSGKEDKIWPFLAGAIIYAMILIPLG